MIKNTKYAPDSWAFILKYGRNMAWSYIVCEYVWMPKFKPRLRCIWGMSVTALIQRNHWHASYIIHRSLDLNLGILSYTRLTDDSLVLVLRKMEGGLLLTNSVPFSCCDILSPRPCIEVDVIDSSRHFAYDASSDLTIYQTGCVDQLTSSLNHRAIQHLDNILLSLFIMMVKYTCGIRSLFLLVTMSYRRYSQNTAEVRIIICLSFIIA